MSSAIPIRNGGDQGIPIHFHRDSVAHTQGMGGISWGGASVGSWLRDEVLMATKEPRDGSHDGSGVADSMLHHGSIIGSYVDSLSHHDSASHSGSLHNSGAQLAMSPDQLSYFSTVEANFCKDYACCGNLLPTLHDLLRHYEEQHISPSPPNEPPVMRRMQNIETVSTNDVFLPFNQPTNDHNYRYGGQVGGLGNMGDLDVGLGDGSQQVFAPPSFQPLDANNPSLNTMGAHAGGNKQFNRNFSGNQGINGMAPQGINSLHAGGLDGLGGQQSHIQQTSVNGIALGDDDEPTIDDPARQLYMLERTENKPFKCPVIGCEKTYKNQNGLKYHRQHGHQNQTLHLNDDGTYSIIDPLSNTPYPDGMGMEKDKPYRCEICGKRYKNLNGLKYHRAHSTH